MYSVRPLEVDGAVLFQPQLASRVCITRYFEPAVSVVRGFEDTRGQDQFCYNSSSINILFGCLIFLHTFHIRFPHLGELGE